MTIIETNGAATVANLDPILTAVQQALMLCREVQHKYLMSNVKSGAHGKEPVTIADYGSQAIICRAISQHYPDDGVLSEEQGSQFLELVSEEQRAQVLKLLTNVFDHPVTQDQVVAWLDHGKGRDTNRTWVIDPIDGTKGFVAMRHYAVAVGLVENGKPVEAVMACPGYGDGVSAYDDDGMLFYTDAGTAYMQPLVGGGPVAIQVSARTNSDEMVIVQSFEKQHASKSRMTIVRELAGLDGATVRDLDSMEKYALVANGDADLYMRLPRRDQTRPHLAWDHAAGVALVETAGGRVSDVDGSPLDFSQGRILPNKGMLVSNGVIHDRVVEATQEMLRREDGAN